MRAFAGPVGGRGDEGPRRGDVDRLAVDQHAVRIAHAGLQARDRHDGREVGLIRALDRPEGLLLPVDGHADLDLGGTERAEPDGGAVGADVAEHRPAEMRHAGLGTEPLHLRVACEVGKRGVGSGGQDLVRRLVQTLHRLGPLAPQVQQLHVPFEVAAVDLLRAVCSRRCLLSGRFLALTWAAAVEANTATRTRDTSGRIAVPSGGSLVEVNQ